MTGKTDCYQIKSLQFDRVKNGSTGNKPNYTFDIRTKSVHGDYYNKHFHASKILLKNNVSGRTTTHTANRETH